MICFILFQYKAKGAFFLNISLRYRLKNSIVGMFLWAILLNVKSKKSVFY